MSSKGVSRGAPLWQKVAIGFGFLIAIRILSSVLPGTHPFDEKAAPQPKPDPSVPVLMPAAFAEPIILPTLRDPDSAKISGVTFRVSGGLPITCGLVNAKNGFGGYTGNKGFIAIGKVLVGTEETVSAYKWPKLWNSYCAYQSPRNTPKP